MAEEKENRAEGLEGPKLPKAKLPVGIRQEIRKRNQVNLLFEDELSNANPRMAFEYRK